MKMKRWLKVLMFLVKVAVSLVILILIFRRIDGRGVFATMLSTPIGILAVLIGLGGVKHGLHYLNWRYVLEFNPGYQVKGNEALISYLIGAALRFLIPGGHATYGKMFYLSNVSIRGSVMSVTFEKMFQTWTIWMMAGSAALTGLDLLPWWSVAVFCLLCAVFPLAMYYGLGISGKTALIKPAYARRVPLIISWQTLSLGIVFIQYWLLLNRFYPVSYLETGKVFSLVHFAHTIPISISGLGLRESFAIWLLRDSAFTATLVVSVTLTVFVVNEILPALIGAVLLMVHRTKRCRNINLTKSVRFGDRDPNGI
ncbi:MAG: flippase-like domain-containing protein [Candidatus Cloacimonetes bacterium]|nr:flippase-like domain-containing protein [Candidatus Cloacimonadota bacterium]